MKKAECLFVLCIILAFLEACSVIDPPIQIPSYIHIDSIHVSTNYPTQGTASSNITDAWVYVNDQYLGTFPLPATFPVLSQGINTVSVDAGIEISGISANRGQYPFYGQFTQNATLTRGQKITISPTVTYLPTSVLVWKEDFDEPSTTFQNGQNGGSPVPFQKLQKSPLVFQGLASGMAIMDSIPQGKDFFEQWSSNAFVLPADGSPVYLELNYLCNNSFTVGLYTSADTTAPIPVINMNPCTQLIRSQWRKIYINLTPALQAVNAPPYYIYFYMDQDAGVAVPALYIDNVKLLIF